MAGTLLAGEQHSLELLAVATASDGALAAPFKVEARVIDESDGLPGEQVVPDAGWLDVTNVAAARLGVGRYGVVVDGAPWAPADPITRGRVDWRFQMSEGGPVRRVTRTFEVLASTDAREEFAGLALVQDVRDLGVGAGVTNARIHAELRKWRDILEEHTRNQFHAEHAARYVDAIGGDVLFLRLPVLLESISVSGIALDNDGLTAYGATSQERRNPRIEIARQTTSDIYVGTAIAEFVEGGTVLVTGVWGFLDEATQEAPKMVRDAAALGAKLSVAALVANGGQAAPVPGRRILRERTDAHEIQYGDDKPAGSVPVAALLRDPLIAETVKLYRAPLMMAAVR